MSSPSEPVWCLGDEARIHQILGNLLDNAIKHTAPDGTIVVTVEPTEGMARIRVCDDGAGIRPEALPHLFESFYQATASTDRAHGGLGLGLAIVQRLAELHGGRASAESQGLGRGSTFTIELPLSQPSAFTSAAAIAPQRSLHVLYVEDQEDAAWSLGAQLESWGMRVTRAADGLAAIDAVSMGRARYDVALVDIALPGADGYAVANVVRELSPHTRLIALTGFSTPDHRARATAAGFQHHLSKPVDLDALRSLLCSPS